MAGAEEQTRTTMEVDSIVARMATESTQVALDITKVVTKIVRPPTLSTILKTKEGIKNLQ